NNHHVESPDVVAGGDRRTVVAVLASEVVLAGEAGGFNPDPSGDGGPPQFLASLPVDPQRIIFQLIEIRRSHQGREVDDIPPPIAMEVEGARLDDDGRQLDGVALVWVPSASFHVEYDYRI